METALRRRLYASLLLALLGAGIALYLTYVAIWEEGNAFCTGIGDCRRVQQSDYARVGGIPVAVFGLGMYVVLITMLALRRWRSLLLPRPLEVWTVALAAGGVLFSGYLTWLEIAVIHAICVWCIASATVITAICTLAIPDLWHPGKTAEERDDGDESGSRLPSAKMRPE